MSDILDFIFNDLTMLALVVALLVATLKNGKRYGHTWNIALAVPLVWLATYYLFSLFGFGRVWMKAQLVRPAYAMLYFFLICNLERDWLIDVRDWFVTKLRGGDYD